MGNKKKTFLLVILTLLVSFAAFTKQVSIQVIQHTSAKEAINEMTLIVEDALLNGFFEYGYIVTNSKAAISSNKSDDQKLWSIGLGDAYEGSSDYYVKIDLFYKLEKVDIKEIYIINKVEWNLSSVNTGENIKKGTIITETEDAYVISSELISEIYYAINANKA